MERLKNHREFVAVLRAKRKASSRDFIVHVRFDDGTRQGTRPARVGLAVSKCVGNAVHRNAVKRRFRVLAQRHAQVLPDNCDIVMRAKPSAAHADFASLDEQVGTVFAKVARMADQS